MITLYTIGFTKKSAERFFTLLKDNGVKQLVDVRISNNSQLAGFAKGKDLEFFVKEICHIPYKHIVDFAPSKEFENSYRQEEINDWLEEFDKALAQLIEQKKAIEEQIVAIRTNLIKQMEQRGLEKVDSKQFSIIYTPARTIMRFDSKAFRIENEDLYAHYCKSYDKEASIVVRKKQQQKE